MTIFRRTLLTHGSKINIINFLFYSFSVICGNHRNSQKDIILQGSYAFKDQWCINIVVCILQRMNRPNQTPNITTVFFTQSRIIWLNKREMIPWRWMKSAMPVLGNVIWIEADRQILIFFNLSHICVEYYVVTNWNKFDLYRFSYVKMWSS